MTATYAIVTLATLVGIWGIVKAIRALRVIRDLHGPRVVTCPETGQSATVHVDLRHAGTIALGQHPSGVRLSACSRWAERGRCEEPCVGQATDPTSTPRAIVARAVSGTPCAFCGRAIECVAFLDHYAAFLRPDGRTIEWSQVPPERLRDTIPVCPAVCWDCHIAETFRRMHPELVTERPWPRGYVTEGFGRVGGSFALASKNPAGTADFPAGHRDQPGGKPHVPNDPTTSADP